jgi:hypothetical protein
MKRIAISILLLLVFSVVFAQEDAARGRWYVAGEVQVFTDVFHYTTASGRIETKDDSGSVTVRQWGDNIKGSLNVLNSSIGPAPDFWTAIYFGYDSEMVKFAIQLAPYELFNRGPMGGSLLTNSKTTWADLLNGEFNEWFLSGKAGMLDDYLMFEGYVGNTGFGGFVDVYDNFTDWANFKLEDFYVNIMGEQQISNNMKLWNGGSAFAAGVTFADSFRFALGSDFGFGGHSDSNSYRNPQASANSFNAAAMFSGKKIAGIADFDLFYGIFGHDDNTNVRGTYNPLNPPADLALHAGGAYNNVFGAYVGINVLPGLGISIGYSGNKIFFEKQGYDKSDDADVTDYHSYDLVSPLWNSVHLIVNYTGIPKMDITFSNNISFASVTSSEVRGDHPDKIVLGLKSGLSPDNPFISLAEGFTGWNKDEKESWFGYDAAIALR